MSSPLDDNESSPGAVHDGQPPPAAAFTVDDIDSLQPGRCVSTAVIEEFFRSQFEECLRQEMLGGNLESCLVFGPDTFADLRRLMLPDGEPADGQQSFPALERFCREHDMASKQYLLLPLLTPGHGSLLVLCKPVQRQAQVEAPGTKDTELESVLRQMGVHQPWLLLHFDSLSGHGSLKGNAPDCAALLRFLKPYVGQEFEAEMQALKLHTAHVPQQGQPGLGSTFMCTNALYFVANLPPIIQGHFVEKMKDYKEKPKDLFENLSHRGFPWYPGFLSTEWYPRNVPEALRKLLLSGVMARLQAHTNSPETAAVLARASEVRKILHSASARQFEMPAQRLKKQLEMKRARQLAAGRRHWASGWTAVTLSGIVTCSLGTWSIQLRGNLRTTVLQFEDVLFDGQLPPRPAEFDYCFGVRLKPGQQPPPFVVHIPPHLLPQTAQRAAAAAGQAERQVEMRFAAEPVTAGTCTLWPLEKSCWDELCSQLGTAVDGCRKLSLVQRPGTGGKAGLVHVDLELELAPQPVPLKFTVRLPPNSKQLQQEARPLPVNRVSREPQRTAGTGTPPDAAQQPGSPGSPGGSAAMPDAGGSLKAPDSPQHTAGTSGTADPADMAAASFLAALPLWGPARPPAHAAAASGLALQTTEKGAKRLLTGKDGGGDRRARLTVRGQKYYAGYFPTGAAAAQAEDLMVIWVHYSSLSWPDRWMQGCSALDNKLNFPATFHLATHKQLVASLSSCPDKDALRRLLQKHLNAGGQQPSELAESSRQAVSQGGPSASPRSDHRAVAAATAAQEQPAAPGASTKRPAPAESAAAGSSLGAKRQRGAATGERQVYTRSLRSSSTAQDAEQQQGQQQGAPTGQQGVEDALEQSSRQQAQQQPQAEQAQEERHVQQEAQQPQEQAQPQPQQQQQQQPWEQQEAQPQAMEVDAAAPPPLQPQQARQQPVAEPKQENEVLPQVHSLATGSPLLLQPGGRQAVAASAGQQLQPPVEAVSAAGAGTGQHPLLPISSAVAALRTMLQGSGGDGDGWPADVRQQAADALAATSAAATETELIAAQIDAIHAALKPLEVPFSARLACTRRFRQLPAVQRSGLLAELRNIVREGSTADLLDWMQEVAAS